MDYLKDGLKEGRNIENMKKSAVYYKGLECLKVDENLRNYS